MSDNDSPESQSGQYLLGMLVMQDVQLGILIALLPAFGDSNDGEQAIIFTTFFILLKTIASFIIVMGESHRSMLKQTLNRHRRVFRAVPFPGWPLCSTYTPIFKRGRTTWFDFNHAHHALDHSIT